MAKANKKYSTLLRALEPLYGKLSSEAVKLLSSLKPGDAITAVKFPDVDLAKVLASIDPATIESLDSLVGLRRQFAEHPELLRLFDTPATELLTRLEADDHSEAPAASAEESDPGPNPTPASQTAHATDIEPFRSGAAGRPSAMDVIVREAERRIETGQVIPRSGKGGNRDDVAERLCEWWKTERTKYKPHGPKVTKTTIYNRLGPLWRKPTSGISALIS
jgi:hypothetical protein